MQDIMTKDIFEYLWNKKTKYMLWGADDRGFESLVRWERHLNIIKLFDSDEAKQGKIVRGLTIEKPIVEADGNSILIVTCHHFSAIRLEAEKMGFVYGKTLFFYLDFEKLYLFLRFDFLLSNRIDISLTERCTLRCAGCNMWMPLFESPKDQFVDNVKKDVDMYFEIVHHVRRLNLLGGEPFLYSGLTEILDYIGSSYRHRISSLSVFTNGSIIPNEALLNRLVKYDVTLSFTNYCTVAPGIAKTYNSFLKICENHGIKVTHTPAESWSDFGFPSNPPENSSDAASVDRFTKCIPPWRGLYNGRFYYCHLETSAERAGLFTPEARDYFDLTTHISDNRERFFFFDFGCVEDGFISFCRVCRGCGGNPLSIKVGAQM